jgi:hypothetical protein
MSRKLEMTENLFVEYAKEIEEVLRAAVRRAVLEHKRAGNPIAVWKEGRVTIVPPEEIILDDSPTEN